MKKSERPQKPRSSALVKNALEASDFLKSIGSPTRLLILCRLMESKCNVDTLVRETGLSQSLVSQSLARMRAQGFVTFERQGKEVYYSLVNSSVKEILYILYKEFCQKK